MDTRPDPGSAWETRPLLPQAAPTGGARLGPYTVLRELGRGGMGVVLEALHDSGARVALKVLTGGLGGAHGAKRFEREVEAVARLRHPHIVGYHGAGAGPPAWLAMEFVGGGDLEERLRTGPLSYSETARVLAEVSEAIAYAHAQGTIHRDLKPANVLLRESDGAALVTDFGLARDLDASRFTQSGAMVGTLAYMAPEQARGERVLPPADVWALGAVLYACLTGEAPFAGESSLALAAALEKGQIERPRKLAPSVPPDLESVCLSCLQQAANDRPTAHEVAAALRARRPLQPLPSESRSQLALVLGVLAALTLAVLGGLMARGARTGLPSPTSSTEGKGGAGVESSPLVSVADADSGSLRVDPAPWPRDSGRLCWALGQSARASQVDPELWTEPARPAPLAPAERAAPGELVPGFRGEARALEGGKIRVRYLGSALRAEAMAPGSYFIEATHGEDFVLAPEGADATSFRAANDMAGVQVGVGEAVWAPGVGIRFDLREMSPVDARQFTVDLGAGAEAPRAWLNLDGRAGHLRVGGAALRVDYRPSPDWRELRFTPGGPVGERVVFGGDSLTALAQAAAAPAPLGSVRFTFHETHQALRGIDVTGRPLRTDRPALALTGAELPSGGQVALALSWEDEGLAGGPLVGLADAAGRVGYWLELRGALLVLRRDAEILARARFSRAPSRGARGWLSLSRSEAELSGVAQVGEETLSLSALDPLPPPAFPLAACYGSSGPALRCERVEVRAHARDPEWEAEERALLDGAEEPTAAGTARALWRSGALALARVSDPGRAGAEFVGPAARSARRAAAKTAAERLEVAARSLPPRPQVDARARALLARVVAGDAEGATRASEGLIQAAGVLSAREALNAIWWTADGRALIDTLVTGYVSIKDVDVREAALRGALLLAPEREAEVLFALSINVKHRDPRPDPQTPAGRAALEGALDLLSRARLSGYPDKVELDGIEADYLTQLGRIDDALERWARVCAEKNTWWAWMQRAHCLDSLGRSGEALEAALGCLAAGRSRPSTHQLVVDLVNKVGRERPGLAAAALTFLGEVLERADLGASAEQLATQSLELPGEEGDLAGFVLARAGRPIQRVGRAPSAVLARARSGDSEAQRELRAAADANELVRTLARLDPELRALLGQ